MRTFVWVDSWQQQCCGDEFRVGSAVRWDVLPAEEGASWVTTLLGPAWGAKVRYFEDHHGGRDDAVGGQDLRGVVQSIHVVTCDRTLKAGAGQPPGGIWLPVPGSGRLREVECADPWEPEPPWDAPQLDEPSPGGGTTRLVVDPLAWSFEGWIVSVGLKPA